jgi:hypothetical protein
MLYLLVVATALGTSPAPTLDNADRPLPRVGQIPAQFAPAGLTKIAVYKDVQTCAAAATVFNARTFSLFGRNLNLSSQAFCVPVESRETVIP